MNQVNLFCIPAEELAAEAAALSPADAVALASLPTPPTLAELRASVQPAPRVDARTLDYSGPWPRGRHSHRCSKCISGTACYKSRCTLPNRLPYTCSWCR